MKKRNNIIQTILALSLLLWLAGCNEDVTEFGFDGAISGMLKDDAGNLVAGDIASTNMLIRARGEGDNSTMDIRVKGDGTFGNSKMYPKNFKVYVAGPATMVGDTLQVNFASNKNVKHDFVVVPFLTMKTPAVSGTTTDSTITVSYEIVPNGGKTTNLRQIYCSTNPYPNSSTGDGPFYHSKTVAVTPNAGNATITGLKPNTKYYIRLGARAAGQNLLNFSDQITVTTAGG